ncbi:hypothetical protein ACTWPT_42940 [Nonomuraea sp. 3N208]|uniref:hypothetical protein n=1 Tax=Nonomuraea sp. 3N208 TaxID=3457421 RepID=UPI003FD1EC05
MIPESRPGSSRHSSGLPGGCSPHEGGCRDDASASPTGQVTHGTTRIRWTIIWLAFAGLSINYLDRASLSVALPFMGEDFQLTAMQQGLVFAAFFWAYDARSRTGVGVAGDHGARRTGRIFRGGRRGGRSD